jgi:hypothetical protein
MMEDDFFFHYTYRYKREEMLDALWRKKSFETKSAGTNRMASKLEKRNYNNKRASRVIVVDLCCGRGL